MASGMYEPAIFTSEQVTYGDFYAWFKAKLVAAGWENISNYATDGDGWHSTGESGAKNYYFNTFAPSLVVSEYYGNGMHTRPYLKYVPGALGVAGVFTGDGGYNTSLSYPNSYKLAMPSHTSAYYPIASDIKYTVSFSITKDRIILTLTLPEGLFAYPNLFYGRSNLWYIGATEMYSTPNNDADSPHGLIIFGSTLVSSGTNRYYQGQLVYNSANTSTVLGTYLDTPYYTLDASAMFRIPSISGKSMLLDIVCGGAIEGMLFRLTDVFIIPENVTAKYTEWFDGDLVSDGEFTYKVIVVQLPNYRIHPLNYTNKFVIRVS